MKEHMMSISESDISNKRLEVNAAYVFHGFNSPQYQKSFDELHDMNMEYMANLFRKQRGLPPDSKTPYDPEPVQAGVNSN
jgi:hypothetical protein